jgi:hypothetical protein
MYDDNSYHKLDTVWNKWNSYQRVLHFVTEGKYIEDQQLKKYF